MIAAFIIILAIALIKYKPLYKVTVSGKEIGYVTNKEEFEKLVNDEILNPDEVNIAYVDIEDTPSYELIFTDSSKQSEEQEVFTQIQEMAVTTYKIYAVTINNENTTYLNSKDEAEETIAQIKEEYSDKIDEIEIGIDEIYTQDIESVESVELASAVSTTEEELTKIVEEQEKIKSATFNGVYFSVRPVTGNITSRFGANESIRDHTHKGIDIAAPNGTSIKAAADGTISFAGWYGGYGNLVIIDHGNGIQTYYGHCSKLYVSKGEVVTAGDVIAAVGSTGESTGNHLHFEIRKNGTQVNPQTYIYK